MTSWKLVLSLMFAYVLGLHATFYYFILIKNCISTFSAFQLIFKDNFIYVWCVSRCGGVLGVTIMPMKGRRGFWTLLSWSYRWLWAAWQGYKKKKRILCVIDKKILLIMKPFIQLLCFKCNFPPSWYTTGLIFCHRYRLAIVID